jgi:hypothetical protein
MFRARSQFSTKVSCPALGVPGAFEGLAPVEDTPGNDVLAGVPKAIEDSSRDLHPLGAMAHEFLSGVAD